MAYTLIETVTVGSGGASSIEFTGIPQEAGADLVIRLSSRNGEAVTNVSSTIQINGVTSANHYTWIRLLGTGSAVNNATASDSGVQYQGQANDTTANTFDSQEFRISNYSATGVKSFSIDGAVENNATAAGTTLFAGSSSGTSGSTTAAVTSVKLAGSAGSFLEHSTASLYLVTTVDASGATGEVPRATGGTISESGGYVYHTFTASGTFTAIESLSTDVVIVAGGGGGSNRSGGGAGGVLSLSSSSLGAYTVTVGAGGGGGGTQPYPAGDSGSNSSFAGLTTAIGGGGAGGDGSNGKNGGSGGGANDSSSAGSGTAGQGNDGGYTPSYSSPYRGGGGGGAGTAGANGGNGTGIGGDGVAISGFTMLTGAGGGGGGGASSGSPVAGGAYGGGSGGINGGANSTAGTAYTGGGGGGDVNKQSANGGSGIVIVRYAA